MAGASDQDDDHGEPFPVTGDGLVEINRWWTVSRIVTNASHDLNNALQIISGNIEMLRAKGDLDSVTARRAESIAAQAERAAATIDRLVSYVRDDQAAPQRIDLKVTAGHALALRSVTLSRRRIATTLSASDDQPYWVAIDPQQAMQLLLNLLLSAEQDMSGLPAGEITVQFSRAARSIEVLVQGRAAGRVPRADAPPQLAFAMASRAVVRLASRCGGRLVVEGGADGGSRATLSLASSE